jgi:hypothetical protein
MTLSRRAVLFGAVSLVAMSRVARSDEVPLPPIDDVLAKIARARATLKTLVGPFTQARKIGMLATEVKSTGAMTLVRPDRLRWELFAPDEIIYWVTPEGLAYKSKNGQGRAPGNVARIAAVLADLRVVLGGDLGALRARYELTLVSATNGAAFEATPRKPMPGVLKIAFALGPDLVRPTRATLVESARDKTGIVFGDLQRDVAVDPAKMRPPT